MATGSFSRTFTVNPDWGIKNLEKAKMRLECTELREFMDLVGEDRALQALSSFSVKRNLDASVPILSLMRRVTMPEPIL